MSSQTEVGKEQDLAYVTPHLIKWARERSGLNTAKLADKLKTPEHRIIAWERGISHPTFNQAARLAGVLRIPFGYLFLSAPPPTDIPLPDLRTLSGTKIKQPSADFLEVLYSVLNRQEWYRDYAEDQGAQKLPFVSSFDVTSDAGAVATDIRKRLGINRALRLQITRWSEYFRAIRRSAESAGIMVMRSGIAGNNTKRPLSVDEFQGFAVSDPVAPIIFVNGRDFVTAQIFTLVHELAHIWVGESGISNPDETQVTPVHDIESFCNEVAAETLVPRFEFEHHWQHLPYEAAVSELARYFRVSTLVVIRRAYQCNKINKAQFYAMVKIERDKQKKDAGGGGDYYQNIQSRLGVRFTEAVVGDVRQGGTVLRDAARLLDVNVPNLINFMEWSG